MTEKVTSLKIPKIIPVILCGGSGTRLWPLSQGKTPKQLLPIVNKTILLHDTLQRIDDCLDNVLAHTITVTTEDLSEETLFQLNAFHPICTNHVLKEPISKNTAAAIAYSALYAKEKFGQNTYLWVLPADHHVKDHENLKSLLAQLDLNELSHKILTFGIKPTSPQTGYGYIEYDQKNENSAKPVLSFTEKPNEVLAKDYIAQGNYLWNSGMFLAKTETLIKEFINYAPKTLSYIHSALNNVASLAFAYNQIDKISFDHAIMEKTNQAHVIEIDIGWSDVGSWQTLWNLKDKDEKGNVFEGNIQAKETENCFIKTDNLTISTMGLKDIVIVETENQILIADRHLSHNFVPIETKATPQKFSASKALMENLEYKIEELKFLPSQKSDFLQNKKHRQKFIIISGEARIILDQISKTYYADEVVHIPPTIFYQIINNGQEDLIILVLTTYNSLALDEDIKLREAL